MYIYIEPKYNKVRFIKFLIKKLVGLLCEKVNLKKLKDFDNYLKEKKIKKVKGKKVFFLAINHIVYKNSKIQINESILYPGTDYKLIDLCKLLNYGNLEFEGYPIFSTVFDFISDNIKKYESMFVETI